jgi:iron complex transport system substrate-binding protein
MKPVTLYKQDYAFSRRFFLSVMVLCWVLLPRTATGEETVTDQLGRTLVLKDRPQRIVSLAPSITEILFAIGQGSRVVGVTEFSNYPPEAADLPEVGSYVQLDIERIIALRPDLCIATRDGNPIEVISVLESLKVPVYAVDPRNLKTVMETVEELGKLLHAETEARKVISGMEERIQRVERRVASAKTRPKVFYQIGISPIVSAGTNTCIHELIQMAGGENIARGPAAYPRMSHEQVLGLSPDIIIITSMARGAVFETVKQEWAQWQDIPAVKNNRISVINSDLLDRPTPRLAEGLELLADILHPEGTRKNP